MSIPESGPGRTRARPKRTLSVEHAKELNASGIPVEYALANGVYTETDPAKVAELLNWDRPATALGPCLVFEHLDADGIPTAYARCKPTNPRTEPREGGEREIKYETRRKTPLRVFIPTGTRVALTDPTIELIVTEGEKKALCADYHGFPCLSIPGVDTWCKNGELIPSLAAIPWAWRTVYIVYDSDAAINPNVRRAEVALAKALVGRRATVKIIRLPEGGAA